MFNANVSFLTLDLVFNVKFYFQPKLTVTCLAPCRSGPWTAPARQCQNLARNFCYFSIIYLFFNFICTLKKELTMVFFIQCTFYYSKLNIVYSCCLLIEFHQSDIFLLAINKSIWREKKNNKIIIKKFINVIT